MKKQILLAVMLMLSAVSFSTQAAMINGSFEFGGLIDGSTVDLPLFTDNQVEFQASGLSNVSIGNLQGDISDIFGTHDMIFGLNSVIELQPGTYNDNSFLTFLTLDFSSIPALNALDFVVTLLTIDSISQPTNSGIGLLGTVMLSSGGYDDTLAQLSLEISENGTYSSSGSITTEVATVPAPAAIWCMLMGLPMILKMSRNKSAVQQQTIA